jgi:cobalt-zinc-cadmium efflux system outer membrane protein
LESAVRGTQAAQPAQALEAVVQARPDIREASARVTLAEARVEEARRAGRFDMTLSASYDRMTFDFSQRGFDETGRLVPIEGIFHSMTVGAMLTLPVRQRNQGAVAAAQAEQSGAQEALAARQRAARAELDAALVRDREAERAVELYTSSVRERARQNVDIVLEAYDLGRLSLSELLAEQRRYLEVEAGYTDLLSRAYQARVALRRARGEIR